MTSINDYTTIFETVGLIIRASSNDCKVYDWNSSCLETLKPSTNWYFKFAPVKQLIMSKSKQNNILVREKPYYHLNIGQKKGLCKRGKTLTSMEPKVINKGVLFNTAKMTDVNDLLEELKAVTGKIVQIFIL